MYLPSRNKRIVSLRDFLNKNAKKKHFQITKIQSIIDKEHKIIKKYKSKINASKKIIKKNQDMINSLITFSDNIINSLNNRNSISCPICLDNISENVAITSCGHIYCHKCLETALKYKNECSICRNVLNNDNMEIIRINSQTSTNVTNNNAIHTTNPTNPTNPPIPINITNINDNEYNNNMVNIINNERQLSNDLFSIRNSSQHIFENSLIERDLLEDHNNINISGFDLNTNNSLINNYSRIDDNSVHFITDDRQFDTTYGLMSRGIPGIPNNNFNRNALSNRRRHLSSNLVSTEYGIMPQ